VTARAPCRLFPLMMAATCRGLVTGNDKTSSRSKEVASRIGGLNFINLEYIGNIKSYHPS